MKQSEKINLREEFSKEDYKSDQVQFSINLSKQISFSFLQMMKYSEIVQEEINKNDIIQKIEQEIVRMKNTFKIKDESIKIFFDLINEENVEISNEQYGDLFKLSTIFKINTLHKYLLKYAKNHSKDIEFIIIQIQENLNEINSSKELIENNGNSSELEKCLIDKINECFTNEKFNELPISIIYRIIKESSSKELDSNLLYDFIEKKKEERYVLFGFLNIDNLNEDKFNELYHNYINDQKSQSSNLHYYEYLKHNLTSVKQLRDDKKILENKVKNCQINNEQLQAQINQMNEKIQQLQAQINQTNNENQNLKSKIGQMNVENEQLQIELKHMKDENKKVESIVNIQFSDQNTNGIFNYFLQKSNINEEVNITSSSIHKGDLKPIIRIDNKSDFYTNDSPNSWFCFEFKKHKIIPTNYTLKSHSFEKYTCKPKSWVIEGLTDQNKWEKLDEQNDCPFLNGEYFIHTFPIMKKEIKEGFKFIRIRQTGKTWNGNDCLALSAIEFFGQII